MKLHTSDSATLVLEMTPGELDGLWRIAATASERYDDLDHTPYELTAGMAEGIARKLEQLVGEVSSRRDGAS